MNDDKLFSVLNEIVGLYSVPIHNYKATLTVHDHSGIILPAGAFNVELHLTHTASNIAVSRGFAMEDILHLLGATATDTSGQVVQFLDITYKEMYAELDKEVEAYDRRHREEVELSHKGAENPDLIQHVIAFRAWHRGNHTLRSTGVESKWKPGVNHAVCNDAGHPMVQPKRKHAAPHPDCACGLYGLFDLDAAAQMGNVLGAVKYWGRIEVHDNGLRAEYAEIVALGSGATKEMAEHFKVPLVHDEYLAEEAKKHGIVMPKELRPEPPPFEEAPQNPFSGGLSVQPAVVEYKPISWQPVPVPTKVSVPEGRQAPHLSDH